MGTNSIHNSTYENDGTGEQREALGKASQCLSALTCIVHKRGAECQDVKTNSVLLEKAVKYEIAPQKILKWKIQRVLCNFPVICRPQDALQVCRRLRIPTRGK